MKRWRDSLHSSFLQIYFTVFVLLPAFSPFHLSSYPRLLTLNSSLFYVWLGEIFSNNQSVQPLGKAISLKQKWSRKQTLCAVSQQTDIWMAFFSVQPSYLRVLYMRTSSAGSGAILEQLIYNSLELKSRKELNRMFIFPCVLTLPAQEENGFYLYNLWLLMWLLPSISQENC